MTQIIEFKNEMTFDSAEVWPWREGKNSAYKHGDFLEVDFILSGNGTQIINDELYSVQAGDILIHNAGVLRDESLMHFAQVDMLCLAVKNFKLPGRPANELLPKKIFPKIPCQSAAGELAQLYKIVQEGDDGANEATRKILLIVCKAINSIGRAMSDEKFFLAERVRKHIEEHYDEYLTLDELYKGVPYDEYYIGRLFKKATGFSPKRYVLRRRISIAQSLLINTSLLLTEISSRVGYDDPNYFGRRFKKIIGMSPLLYRKKWRELSAGSVPSDV